VLDDIDRHVTGSHLNQETRVQRALDDIAGMIWRGSKVRWMTQRAQSGGPQANHGERLVCACRYSGTLWANSQGPTTANGLRCARAKSTIHSGAQGRVDDVIPAGVYGLGFYGLGFRI